jgi:hypothetical protein
MHRLTLLENQTTDTTTGWVKPPSGVYTIFFLGDLDGGTLTLKFSHNHADANPDSPDFTFTAPPPPFQFRMADGFSVAADLAGAGGGADVTFGIQRDSGK